MNTIFPNTIFNIVQVRCVKFEHFGVVDKVTIETSMQNNFFLYQISACRIAFICKIFTAVIKFSKCFPIVYGHEYP